MSTRSLPEVSAPERHSSLFEGILHSAPTKLVVGAAFWLAILLPFLHVPLLATEFSTPGYLGAYLGLVGLNVVCLVLGHGRGR